MGKLIFNGVSTEDLGVVIQAPPIYEFPSKRYNIVQIEGKSGDIVIDKKAYNNVSREYRLVSVFRKNTGFIENVREIVDWLTSANGYVRLEDSYEPDYFRLAMFRSGGQLPNLHDRATGINVTFECKPQRYLKSGDEEIDLKVANPEAPDDPSDWYEIVNPTNNIALPIFKISNIYDYLSVVKILIISGSDFNNPDKSYELNYIYLPGVLFNEHTIDSELEDIYTEDSFVNNSYHSEKGFPKLYPGKNWIKIIPYDNGNKVKMKPKWWVL